MIETQAVGLLQAYEVIDQHANDPTGFSATLYRNKTTGEYVLSARSTEFREWVKAGDGERDRDGANVKGIVGEGQKLGAGLAIQHLQCFMQESAESFGVYYATVSRAVQRNEGWG